MRSAAGSKEGAKLFLGISVIDGIERDREHGLRVLVVEDEALVSLILEDMLVELGHHIVGPFSILSAGLDSATKDGIDIAIIDVNLRGVSSLPIAHALKLRGIPVVFSTGYGRAGLPEPFADAALLEKPFQQNDIELVIASVLRQS
jgi:two-component SAPR family response regulator